MGSKPFYSTSHISHVAEKTLERMQHSNTSAVVSEIAWIIEGRESLKDRIPAHDSINVYSNAKDRITLLALAVPELFEKLLPFRDIRKRMTQEGYKIFNEPAVLERVDRLEEILVDAQAQLVEKLKTLQISTDPMRRVNQSSQGTGRSMGSGGSGGGQY
jgi:hypothetical protein